MEQRYRIKKEAETSKSKIRELSNGFFNGNEIKDMETAKYLTKSQWKEILNNR